MRKFKPFGPPMINQAVLEVSGNLPLADFERDEPVECHDGVWLVYRANHNNNRSVVAVFSSEEMCDKFLDKKHLKEPGKYWAYQYPLDKPLWEKDNV